MNNKRDFITDSNHFNNGYTNMPNILLAHDKIPNVYAFKLFLTIYSFKNYEGGQKKLSISYLSSVSGMSRDSVMRNTKALEDIGAITVDRQGREINKIMVNQHFIEQGKKYSNKDENSSCELQEVVAGSDKIDEGSSCERLGVVAGSDKGSRWERHNKLNTKITKKINTHRGVGVGSLNPSKENIQSIPYFGILKHWNQHTYKMKMPETAQTMAMVNPLMQKIIDMGIKEQQVKKSIQLLHESRDNESKDHPTLIAYLKRILKKTGQAYEFLFVGDANKKETQFISDHEKLEELKKEYNAICEERRECCRIQKDRSIHVDERIYAQNRFLSLGGEKNKKRCDIEDLAKKLGITLIQEKVA